jgi:hypothetical protein
MEDFDQNQKIEKSKTHSGVENMDEFPAMTVMTRACSLFSTVDTNDLFENYTSEDFFKSPASPTSSHRESEPKTKLPPKKRMVIKCTLSPSLHELDDAKVDDMAYKNLLPPSNNEIVRQDLSLFLVPRLAPRLVPRLVPRSDKTLKAPPASIQVELPKNDYSSDGKDSKEYHISGVLFTSVKKPSGNTELNINNRNALRWKVMYEKVVRFYHENGHCNITPKLTQDKTLISWTKRMRSEYKLYRKGMHSCMTSERINALRKIEFQLSPYANLWNQRFNELCTFIKQNGHMTVSASDPEFKKLFSWIKRQKRLCKKKELDVMRRNNLDSIGFEW